MVGLTREQRAARLAAAAHPSAVVAVPSVTSTPRSAILPAEGCVFMRRDGQCAEVNLNSIAIMRGLGWATSEAQESPAYVDETSLASDQPPG